MQVFICIFIMQCVYIFSLAFLQIMGYIIANGNDKTNERMNKI